MTDHDGSIRIRKAQDLFLVEIEFPNGHTQAQHCNSEQDARVYAQGFLDGMRAVRNLISSGPRYHTKIEEIKS